MNFNEIFRKNVTYNIKKRLKNKALNSLQTVYFFKYILGLRGGFFVLNETSILVFAELPIIQFYLNKNKTEKNC